MVSGDVVRNRYPVQQRMLRLHVEPDLGMHVGGKSECARWEKLGRVYGVHFDRAEISQRELAVSIARIYIYVVKLH